MPSILLTPPATEPISLAEAKAYLRVAHDDDDDVITALIAGSRIHVEAQTRRALITQTWRLTRDSWPASGRIVFGPSPLRELVTARVYDESGVAQDVDLEAFNIDTASAPAIIAFTRGAMPAPGRLVAGIEMDAECGYGDAAGDVPEPLRQAIRLLTAHWYENRGLVALGEQVAVLPANVVSLISPFRVTAL